MESCLGRSMQARSQDWPGGVGCPGQAASPEAWLGDGLGFFALPKDCGLGTEGGGGGPEPLEHPPGYGPAMPIGLPISLFRMFLNKWQLGNFVRSRPI